MIVQNKINIVRWKKNKKKKKKNEKSVSKMELKAG